MDEGDKKQEEAGTPISPRKQHTVVYIPWKHEEELILKDWADKATCFRWLHDRSHQIYRRKYAVFTIPVIILSTITGTANFAQDRFPEDWKNIAVMAVGALNLFAGIISTIAQFLKISELNEGHRVASIAWGKFSRNLKVELARNPKDRTPVRELMKLSKEEYDRLVETSPPVLQKVVEQFMKEVVRKNNHDINLPEICGDLRGASIFHPDTEDEDDFVEQGNNSDSPKVNWDQFRLVERVKEEFLQMNGREPTDVELVEWMKQQKRATQDNLDSDFV
jgi:hypothetical protein